jgi:glycosyltransferase involved in cell wall biosynthesis
LEEAQKRVSDLPRIATALRARGLPFELSIVGDGPQRSQIEKEIARLQLESHVKLLGWQSTEAIWKRMASSDILVLPSNYEGMPLVVMEALALGCAVVASRVSGVEDAEKDPIARQILFTHDVGDVESAANYVARAHGIPTGERRRLARTAAQRLFAIEVCVDRYVDIVRKASSRPTTTASYSSKVLLNRLIALPVAYARWGRRSLSLRSGKRRRQSRDSGL